ncbi:60S ribosomal protein L7A-like protein [Hibiscus syriacus]|uniref:60S ribosomal protein L7A-like protein n=1 Tax=Hibiscus syriacus TaxID=106335 RepID=A0A6A2XAA1_HIBSY|nr:60S ribosomal protein L7A-like protein [Hibiscus syriacus]
MGLHFIMWCWNGPEFPAEQLTNIPFCIAANPPTAMLSQRKGTASSPREIESASTPSSIAASSAANSTTKAVERPTPHSVMSIVRRLLTQSGGVAKMQRPVWLFLSTEPRVQHRALYIYQYSSGIQSISSQHCYGRHRPPPYSLFYGPYSIAPLVLSLTAPAQGLPFLAVELVERRLHSADSFRVASPHQNVLIHTVTRRKDNVMHNFMGVDYPIQMHSGSKEIHAWDLGIVPEIDFPTIPDQPTNILSNKLPDTIWLLSYMVSFVKDPDVIFLPLFPFLFFDRVPQSLQSFLCRLLLSSVINDYRARSRPICHRFAPELKLLDEKLVLAAGTGDSKVFYLKMKGKRKTNISSCRFMAKLKANVLLNAFIALFLISTATAAGDSLFVITHKKASLIRLKSDAERVSVSIEIYNQGFSTAYDGSLVDHSWPQDAFDVISEAKRQGMFYGAPAVITFRIPTKATPQEGYSTSLLPLDILAEILPEKKFDWAKRLLAKYGSQTSVISIVALFVYLLVTPSKSNELVSYGCAAWCCIAGYFGLMKKKEMKVNKNNRRKHRHFRFKSNEDSIGTSDSSQTEGSIDTSDLSRTEGSNGTSDSSRTEGSIGTSDSSRTE